MQHTAACQQDRITRRPVAKARQHDVGRECAPAPPCADSEAQRVEAAGGPLLLHNARLAAEVAVVLARPG